MLRTEVGHTCAVTLDSVGAHLLEVHGDSAGDIGGEPRYENSRGEPIPAPTGPDHTIELEIITPGFIGPQLWASVDGHLVHFWGYLIDSAPEYTVTGTGLLAISAGQNAAEWNTTEVTTFHSAARKPPAAAAGAGVPVDVLLDAAASDSLVSAVVRDCSWRWYPRG